MQIGFVGLGIMGAPMCGHLVRAGHQLFVHTRSKVPPEIPGSGATQCGAAKDVAERVTGAGRAFCAGADLSGGESTFDYAGRGEAAREESRVGGVYRDGGGLATLRIYRSLKPVIGAINGAAVGIGVTMQLPMEIRLASSAARFGFVFARRGIVPEAASSWFLSRVVGHVVDRVVFKTERGYGPAYFVTTIVAQIFLSILASMIVMWFSRRREFRADAGGASLSGRHKMIGALRALQRGQQQDLPGELAAFGIAGGMGGGLKRLFLSHPPLAERIAALEQSP